MSEMEPTSTLDPDQRQKGGNEPVRGGVSTGRGILHRLKMEDSKMRQNQAFLRGYTYLVALEAEYREKLSEQFYWSNRLYKMERDAIKAFRELGNIFFFIPN